ncbi:MAG TPA: response regulator [Elusimicrobiales bacterium]|nr:response regulator [Elusimicrobiales bacterium]
MGRKKILAVDDDPNMRTFYETVLEDYGFEVRTAEDGLFGTAACQNWKPDLLILDWDMPGGGGKRVFQSIRQLLRIPVPVLFVTGMQGDLDVDLTLDRVSILRKPIEVERLLTGIYFLLR